MKIDTLTNIENKSIETTVISENRYLSLEEMKGNAQVILDAFLSYGWTKESICGMLGNMQSESTINPGIWESLDQGNMINGFGLVQWTPASKYTSWSDGEGYSWEDIEGQIKRIQYEVENGLQWIATSSYPMSFEEFTKSTESPTYLANVFITNYERPFEPNQPLRGEQAEYWYKELDGEGGGIDPNPQPSKGDYTLINLYKYCFTDILFGQKYTTNSKKFKLVKRIGDMAIIMDKNRKMIVPFKNLRKAK